MISLEQVRLLEARVSKAIEYVQLKDNENAALISEKAGLQKKLEANQKRIDELEVLVMRFKEDQARIEDGIISALDRLSQFEEALENSLKEDKSCEKKNTTKVREKEQVNPSPAASKEIFFEIQEKEIVEGGELPDGNNSSEGELDIF